MPRRTGEDRLPTRLTTALIRLLRPDATELEGAAWFAELIDNFFAHSRTRLDGMPRFRYIQEETRLSVTVSDRGLGIMQTLPPTVQAQFPRLAAARPWIVQFGSAF